MRRFGSVALAAVLIVLAACGSDSTGPQDTLSAHAAAAQLQAALDVDASGEAAFFGLLALHGGSSVQRISATLDGIRKPYDAVSLTMVDQDGSASDSLAFVVAWRGEHATEGFVTLYFSSAPALEAAAFARYGRALAVASGGRLADSRAAALMTYASQQGDMPPTVSLYWDDETEWLSDWGAHPGGASVVSSGARCPNRSSIGSAALQEEFAGFVDDIVSCSRAIHTVSLTAELTSEGAEETRTLRYARQRSMGARIVMANGLF